MSPNTMNCITIGEDPICIRSISNIYTGKAPIYILSEPNKLICITIGCGPYLYGLSPIR